ncbi:MAG: CaiB/BaiF CoA-transferase family protein [Pseudomonadales bacterium]
MSEGYLFGGLKVLDVGTWIAAPVAATMLADYGADVIKVEMPESGDAYRHFAAMVALPNTDANYTWHLDARNKRSLSLNLKTEQGQGILHRMIAECDVYVTNHPLSMRRELGLSYEDLAPLNERMIYASLTAYGEEGPERDDEGFDLVGYWARSGLMDAVRHLDARPSASLPGMGDHPTGVAMYANIVTGLLRREQTGKGSHVHTSLLANGLWSASCLAQAAFAGADLGEYSQRRARAYIHVPYETSDGRWLVFSMVRTSEHLDLMFAVAGLTEILIDERFATPGARGANGALIVEMLGERIRTRSGDEWLKAYRDMDVPVLLATTVTSLVGDEQLVANNMVMDAPEDMGMPQVIDHPLNQEGLPRKPLTRAPELGEHSREVLGELGYSQAEIDQLAADGVV